MGNEIILEYTKPRSIVEWL